MSSIVCKGKEQEKSLQTKTEVLASKNFPEKKGYSDRFSNWVEFWIVTTKELGK